MQTSHVALNYAPFYRECAMFPELPKFHRFADRWTKKLYDDVEELLETEKELNAEIAALRRSEGGAALTAMECPRRVAKSNKRLRRKWFEYEKRLRLYSQDVCLSHQLINLPSHTPYFSKRLKRFTDLFQNNEFGPTGEPNAAATYQERAARDFVAWVDVPSLGPLINLYLERSEWIEDNIICYLRAWIRCQRPAPRGSRQALLPLPNLIMVADLLTCIFVPLLLTANMFALEIIGPTKVRIAVVGAFGLVFAISAKMLFGGISRGEIFAYTAAYFAVASVFVSGTNGEVVTAL